MSEKVAEENINIDENSIFIYTYCRPTLASIHYIVYSPYENCFNVESLPWLKRIVSAMLKSINFIWFDRFSCSRFFFQARSSNNFSSHFRGIHHTAPSSKKKKKLFQPNVCLLITQNNSFAIGNVYICTKTHEKS